jgi:hypothetical protein
MFGECSNNSNKRHFCHQGQVTFAFFRLLGWLALLILRNLDSAIPFRVFRVFTNIAWESTLASSYASGSWSVCATEQLEFPPLQFSDRENTPTCNPTITQVRVTPGSYVKDTRKSDSASRVLKYILSPLPIYQFLHAHIFYTSNLQFHSRKNFSPPSSQHIFASFLDSLHFICLGACTPTLQTTRAWNSSKSCCATIHCSTFVMKH